MAKAASTRVSRRRFEAANFRRQAFHASCLPAAAVFH